MASIIDLIGNTPLVEIKRLNPHAKVKIYGKLEGQNPGGSVKDRAAFQLIKGALDRGEIGPGTKLVEATSGNTGIALAMIAQWFGIEIELILPENSTKERIWSMEAFGAKVILTPAQGGMEASRDLALEKISSGGYLMLNQFDNPDCALAHYKSTGPEVWRDTEGNVTHFVSAMGTTGTIMGTSRFLKEKNPNIQVVGARPTEGSKIPGIRRWPEAYLPKIFKPELVDKYIDVSEAEATAMTRALAKKEGMFAGMSSGGSVCAALKLAETLEEGCIVCIICDRGDRYLSSGLFAENNQ